MRYFKKYRHVEENILSIILKRNYFDIFIRVSVKLLDYSKN